MNCGVLSDRCATGNNCIERITGKATPSIRSNQYNQACTGNLTEGRSQPDEAWVSLTVPPFWGL